MQGRSNRETGLKGQWQDAIESIVFSNPPFSIEVSANSDISEHGFERVMRALELGYKPVSNCLSLFSRGDWKAFLTEEQFSRILQLLEQSVENNEPRALSTAIDTLWMWTESKPTIPERLASKSLYFLEKAIGLAGHRDAFAWTAIAVKCSEHFPEKVASIAIDWFVRWKSIDFTISKDDLSEVLTAAAKHSPNKIMDVIGQWIKGPNSYLLDLHVFRGLFDAMGLEHVSGWVAINDKKFISKIARHLYSPSLDDCGEVQLAPLTDWFFREFENDERAFQSFLAGRRSEAFWADQVNAQTIQREFEPFLNSTTKLVRDWAKWELKDAQRLLQVFKEMDEDDERR